ncbi:thioredoxin reductase, partial [Mycoplasmopsis edwardii]
MENRKIYDLAIIGGGPAGLNAALYASRANLNVVFIEKSAPGGKLSSTSKIENW